MNRSRKHISVLAMATLVSLLGTTVTTLAGACCPPDAAATAGCSHHPGGHRSAATPEPTPDEACPLHHAGGASGAAAIPSDACALVCGCMADPEMAAYDWVGLLTPTLTFPRPPVAAAAYTAPRSMGPQQRRLPPNPPPRARFA